MKRVLFYFLFWILGVVVSGIIVAYTSTKSFFNKMKSDGVYDPQIVTGALSIEFVDWVMGTLLISVFVYPLFYFIFRRVRFPTVIVAGVCCLGFTLLALSNGLSFEEYFSHYVESLFYTCIFIFLALALPSFLLRRAEEKRKKTMLTETFN